MVARVGKGNKMPLSIPMRKRNEKKAELWAIVACLVVFVVFIGVIWLVAGRAIDANIVEFSKYY